MLNEYKKLNVRYIIPLELSSKYSIRPGRIQTYCVTETSTSDTGRHPIVTYVGVCSRLDNATTHTVIEFPRDLKQIKVDAAITTYVFAIALHAVLIHNFTKTNIKFFPV